MPENDGQVLFEVKADTSGLEKELSDAEKKAENHSRTIQKSLDEIGETAEKSSKKVKSSNDEVTKSNEKRKGSADEVAKASKGVKQGNDEVEQSNKKVKDSNTDTQKSTETQKESYKNFRAELDEVNACLSNNAKNSTLLSQKQELLKVAIAETSEKLKTLSSSQAKVNEDYKAGKIPDEEYRKFQRTIVSTQQELDEYQQELKELSEDHKKAEKSTEDLSNKTSKFAGAAKGAALAIGAAFLTAGAAVVKFGTEFENSMAAASTLIDTSVTDMDALNEKMLTLSDNTNVAASELGNSLYSALSAGIPATEDMSEALDFLEQNTKLAKAGFTDIDTAVNTTAKVLNAYGKDVSETANVHKVLMQVQNYGIATVDELGSCLANVTPTAAAMGVTFEEVGAALATMTAAGTPVAQATTQLNALFNELGQSGSKADIALREMTSTVKAASAEQLKAMQDAFDDEYEAAQESYEAQEKAYQKTLDAKEKDIEGYYDKYTETVEKVHEEELEAFESAHEEKLRLIDEEYTEKLKLIDEERYNAIKAIEDEIDGINAKTAEEEAALEKAEEEEKRKALKERISNAETIEERKEAEKDLADYEAELERKRILRERKERIAELNEKKAAVKEEYDEKAEKLKEEAEAEKAAVNEVYEAEKEAMLDKQELKEKALAAERQAALDNIREINAEELEAFKKTNQKKLESLKDYHSAQFEAAAAGSGDGKGFQDLIAEGKTYADIVRMLEEYAAQMGLTLSDMFGSSEAAKAALGVTGSNADKWDSNLSAMSAEGDVVGDAYEKVTATTEEKFNGVLNTLKNSAIEVFDSIKEKIAELFSEENMEKLNALIKPLKELVERVLPPLFDIVLSLIGPVAELAEQLLPVIEVVIAAVADILAQLAEPLTDIISNVLPVVAELLSVIIEPLSEIISALLPPLLKVLDAVLEPVTELIEKLLPPLTQILTSLLPLFEALIPVIELIAYCIGTLLNSSLMVLEPAFDLIANSLTYFIDTLKNLIDFITNIFANDWGSAWSAIIDQFSNIFGALPQIAENIVNTIIGMINGLINKINSFLGYLNIEIPEIEDADFAEKIGGMLGIPGFSFGNDYIPKDDYVAKLHKGEAVLSAPDAEVFRSLGGKGSLEKLATAPSDNGMSSETMSKLFEAAAERGGDTNITQNNYSPENLSAYDTYRYMQQTAQQLSRR